MISLVLCENAMSVNFDEINMRMVQIFQNVTLVCLDKPGVGRRWADRLVPVGQTQLFQRFLNSGLVGRQQLQLVFWNLQKRWREKENLVWKDEIGKQSDT